MTNASSFEAECDRLRILLADQIERDALQEARETAVTLLCLCPSDPEGLGALSFLDEHLAKAAADPVIETLCLPAHAGGVNCVAFSPDGTMFLSAGVDDQPLRLWEAATGIELIRFQGYRRPVTCAVFSHDSRLILTGGPDGSLCLLDADSGNLVRRFELRAQAVGGVALSPDGRWALSGSADKVLRLWDKNTGARLSRMEGHTQPISSVAISPKGVFAVSTSPDRNICVWDAASGTRKRRLEGHKQGVLGAAFTLDGRQLVSCSADTSIRVWDLESGRELARWSGHTGAVNSIAVSADGTRVVSGSSDQTVRLWELASGRELRRFDGHSGPVMSVAFAPSGSHAVSGSKDGTVRLWHLPSVSVRPRTVEAVESLGDLGNTSMSDLIEAIGRSRILEPDQWEDVSRNASARFSDAWAVAKYLLEKDWTTPYQINQLAIGEERELVIGNYVMLARLGEGGMGEVFRARDLRSKAQVALKIVRPELLTESTSVERFRWEIRTLAQMAHPNVIKILEADQVRDKLFYTMECIDGTDLGRLVTRFGALPVPLACDYIRQAALGLEHAHERSLIHRDIKPANLLLTLPGSSEGQSRNTASGAVVKIIDWGLAGLRLRDPSKKSTEPENREKVIGTADYVAPEQIEDANKADIRADIYSLGCTLYHLLAGKPPFPGGALLQKLIHHQKTEPTSVRQLRPEVPEGLAAVVQKMMAKRPADRYRSPGAAASALTAFSRAI